MGTNNICSSVNVKTKEDNFMIERYLEELKETWSYTTEELRDIKLKMANYAFAACLDSKVRKEIENILMNAEKE